jgi:hypothetical protein
MDLTSVPACVILVVFSGAHSGLIGKPVQNRRGPATVKRKTVRDTTQQHAGEGETVHGKCCDL